MKQPRPRTLAIAPPGSVSTPLKFILATTAAMWMGSATAQWPVAGLRQGQDLRFRDIFSTPHDPDGPHLNERLLSQDGQTVRLVGYMRAHTKATGRFWLTARPPQAAMADALPEAAVLVELDASQQDWTIPLLPGLVAVQGRLHLGYPAGAHNPTGRARLQLAPQPSQGLDASDVSGYVHRVQQGRRLV